MTRFHPMHLLLAILSLIAFNQPSLVAAQQLVFESFPATALVRGENVWLRLDPAGDTDVIDLLQRGDPITITGESVFEGDEEYYPVAADLTGETGWIGALFIDPRSLSGTSAVVVPLDDVAAPSGEDESTEDDANQRQQDREARRQARQAEAAQEPEPEPEPEPDDAANDRAARRAARQAEQGAAAEEEQPADDRAARRAARQENQGANADGANASADTLTFSGEEPTTTPEFTAPSDVLAVTARHDGDGAFRVLAYTPDGDEEVLFDESGPVSEETTFEIAAGSTVILDVEANGPWEVVVESAS